MDTNYDPHMLQLYFQYGRLTAKTLGSLLSELGEMADIGAGIYGKHYAIPMHLPTLEIETARTGDSFKMTLGEGWLPSVSKGKNDDIVINIPKKLGIPLLIGYLLLRAAQMGLNLHNELLDDRIKQIELKLKQQELNKVMKSEHELVPQLLPKANITVKNLFQNEDIKIFQIYDIDIINRKGNGIKK